MKGPWCPGVVTLVVRDLLPHVIPETWEVLIRVGPSRLKTEVHVYKWGFVEKRDRKK